MAGFKSSFKSKSKPDGVANILIKKRKEFQTKKGEKRISWGGSLRLDDGTSIAITLSTDTSGKIMFVDGKGKQEGQKVAFLDAAMFSNSGGGL